MSSSKEETTADTEIGTSSATAVTTGEMASTTAVSDGVSRHQVEGATTVAAATTVMKPLFETLKEDGEGGGGAMLSFAEGFRDKVKVLFEHFDLDQDGYLNFDELYALQRATSSDRLTEPMYVMACQSLQCHPDTGLTVEALKFTYASDGADIEVDYAQVFSTKTKKNTKNTGTKETAATATTKNDTNEAETIYEVGTKDGAAVDISS